MIQLFINGKECDIDKEFDIKLEKDFDMTDIHVIEESEYSFEIELPITKRNPVFRKIFHSFWKKRSFFAGSAQAEVSMTLSVFWN